MPHTKGNLKLAEVKRLILDETGVPIASVATYGVRRIEDQEANAARLVHCWNEHENLIELAKAVLFYHENFSHMKDIDLEKILDAASAAVGTEDQS